MSFNPNHVPQPLFASASEQHQQVSVEIMRARGVCAPPWIGFGFHSCCHINGCSECMAACAFSLLRILTSTATLQGGGGAEDFDLSEVFAEYFINEFDDPLNAYTGGMANYSGSAPSLNLGGGSAANGAVAGQEESSASTATAPSAATSRSAAGLPTGGIRTTFHSGAAAAAPAAKKSKTSADAFQAAIAAAAPTPLSVLASKPGIVGLSSSTQVNHAQHPAPAPFPPTQQSAQQQSLQQAGAQGIVLPVGVGIRLGGMGNVAPQQAQLRPGGQQQQQGVLLPGSQFNLNHTMWAAPNTVAQQTGENNDDEGGSDQAIAERRQRNREHAKRSRIRKKFMLESMQEQVRTLQRENHRLRLLVQEHIPEKAMEIIAECCSKNPLFEDESNPKESKPQAEEKGSLVRTDFSLIRSLTSGQRCFVLSDPTLPDNPVVFATPDFYKLTGYTSKEVLGRNCRFLQGPGTDKKSVDIIRKAITTGSDATVCLLNYKSDGTPFWNQFFIGALRDADNNIVNFVSVVIAEWQASCPDLLLLSAWLFSNRFPTFIFALLSGRRTD